MDKKQEITLFAKTNFRGKEVPFGIKEDDRRRHLYIIGKTGMGKTSMMENMIIQDIINGRGLAFVDPHGDSVEKILNYIPNNRVNDVIYFNPSDLEYPIAFNILESVDLKYKHLVASGLMGVFTKIWANTWSSRMEYILNNTILALLDSPGNTLLGISRIFLDKKYRKRIVDNVKDPMVRAFWTDEFANWQEKYRMEAVAPIQNKVGQFLSSGVIRNIVGQPKSTIDLRQIMDDQKILLLNLSKGRVGEDNSALLGAMIITKLQLAALSRVDMPEVERKDFYLYVDEFQNFATDSFATILSEARKYRLCLTVGHQYIGQLVQEKNTKVRDAVFGNVGTMISFRVGATDAEFLEKEFAPNFTETDLVNLPKYTIILKLMINGVASDPFTAVTLPPEHYEATGNGEKVIRVSRERYANSMADVEERIIRWMGEQEIHDQAVVMAKHVHSDRQNSDEDDADEAAEVAAASAMLENTAKADSQRDPGLAMVDFSLPVQPTALEDAPSNHIELQEKLSEPSAFNAVIASQFADPIPVEPLFEQTQPQSQPQPQPVKFSAPKPVSRPPQQSDRPQRSAQPRQQGSRNNSFRENRGERKNPQRGGGSNPIWNSVTKLNQKNIEHRVGSLFEPKKRGEPERKASQPQENKKHTNQDGQKVVMKPGESHHFD
jgi:hypothetical protein